MDGSHELGAEPPRRIRIAGLGRYLPTRVVTNAELEARFALEPGWILAHNGVGERRRADVDAGETATWMAAAAAREALDEAGLAATDLDLIVNASGTPEQAIPDGAALVQRHLGLGRSGVPCFSVHATCLSFCVALDVVASLVAAGRHRRVLVVSSDIGSASVVGVDAASETLWGDAAAAAVVVPSAPGQPSALHRARQHTWSDGAELTEVRGCGTRLHPGRPGATADDLRFVMRGPEVLRLSLRMARPFLADLLPGFETQGCEGIDVVVPHQPSLAGLDALQALGVPRDRTVVTLAELGNCVAASMPCSLYEATRTGALRRGHRALLIGTGAGLSMAGAVLTY
ncbi:MAG: 3-oxoacyl-[acyl-carrier-protein] synthase III C-terminal domain-containing protein [Planctomycetota bacterium]